MIYICFCVDDCGVEVNAQGDSPKAALDTLISMTDGLKLSTAVFYKAEQLNLRVTTVPVIVPIN